MDKIWIIEDDSSIKRELTTLLQANGYMTVDSLPCELVLLDINMPKKSGYEICRDIRKTQDIPIIFLTARNTSEDELLAFAMGADDYITKPYNSAVLLARIAKRLNRKSTTVLEAAGLKLSLDNMSIEYAGNRIELTKNETRIMYCLMNRELCTRAEIIEDLWNNSLYVDENTLYVNINRLRDKLKTIGAGEFIVTVRGVGYRLKK